MEKLRCSFFSNVHVKWCCYYEKQSAFLECHVKRIIHHFFTYHSAFNIHLCHITCNLLSYSWGIQKSDIGLSGLKSSHLGVMLFRCSREDSVSTPFLASKRVPASILWFMFCSTSIFKAIDITFLWPFLCYLYSLTISIQFKRFLKLDFTYLDNPG